MSRKQKQIQKVKSYITFLSRVERLKSVMRHSWQSSGRRESVPEHAWRFGLTALLLRSEFPMIDIDRVIAMALVHDLGETIRGDTPAFYKKTDHKPHEARDVTRLVKDLPPKARKEILRLWHEFESGRTKEAKLAKALDKLEAIIQHNEAQIDSWLPIEYDFQFTHGRKDTGRFEFTRLFREVVDAWTTRKIAKRK